MSLKTKKIILILAIILSYILVFAFYVPYNIQGTPLIGFIGKLFALCGIIILTWQFLLGARGLVSRWIPDLIWVNKLHQFLGKYGFILIFFHPILIYFYYLGYGENLIKLTIDNSFDYYKLVGEIAFSILFIIWILSALFRNKISFRWWKKIHLLAYVVLPLALFHSYNIGSDLAIPFLSLYWKMIMVIYAIVLIYRLLFNFGILKHKYEVVDIKEVAPNTHTITMKPLGSPIEPIPGQFIYIQPGALAENHPFTASHFDIQTDYLSVTPKASGPFSNMIQNIKVGTKVFVDGPYGVFTKEAYTTSKPVVLIVGGIGITPFLRMIEKIKIGWDKRVVLFYGNKTIQEAAFINEFSEIEKLKPNFKLVNVISEDANYQGEKGRINIDLIKKYLNNEETGLMASMQSEDLNIFDFFVCGPPPMMKAIIAQLKDAGVMEESIHFENFSL